MITYNGFYILDETDFIKHFLLESGKYSSINETIINNFDKEDKSFITFKRKIIAYNLLNPDNSWESKLSIECLKNLNEMRFKQNKSAKPNTIQETFPVGELIFYNRKKGEVVKGYNVKGIRLYDIRIGKEKIEKIYPNELTKRTDVREKLSIIPENIEYKSWKTEKLLAELSRARQACYNYYSEVGDDLPYWQLKKNLLQDHI